MKFNKNKEKYEIFLKNNKNYFNIKENKKLKNKKTYNIIIL